MANVTQETKTKVKQIIQLSKKKSVGEACKEVGMQKSYFYNQRKALGLNKTAKRKYTKRSKVPPMETIEVPASPEGGKLMALIGSPEDISNTLMKLL